MPDVRLRIEGRDYAGWTEVRVTRSLETLTGSFALAVSERWAGQEAAWPIQDEDACEVRIGDAVVLTGCVDTRTRSLDATSHAFRVEGRDGSGALVDSSAVLDRWEFAQVGVRALATALAAPFGIAVAVQAGIADPPHVKLVVNPGETAFEVLDRVCRLVGAIPMADGQGGIVLTRAGTRRTTTAIVEGVNLLTGERTTDAIKRYRRYLVLGQQAGTDLLYGATAASVKAEAQDPGVRRAARVLVVRPEGAVDVAFATARARWEARVRAARADTCTVTVQGWQQADGTLWPVNAIVPVRSGLLGLDGDRLITEVTHTLTGDEGTRTTLTLVPPGAFETEPMPPASSAGHGSGAAITVPERYR